MSKDLSVDLDQIEKAAYTLDPMAWDDTFLVDLQRFHGEVGRPSERRKNEARMSIIKAFRAAGFEVNP